MCESCNAAAKFYGEVLPGLFLERATQDGEYFKTGMWGLVFMNGPDFTFESTPSLPTPTPQHWDLMVEDFQNDLRCSSLDSVYRLGTLCAAAGWEPEDESLAPWLFRKLGGFLAAFPIDNVE